MNNISNHLFFIIITPLTFISLTTNKTHSLINLQKHPQKHFLS